jgi:hypothetical protein
VENPEITKQITEQLLQLQGVKTPLPAAVAEAATD